MPDAVNLALHVALIGAGATLILDLWTVLLKVTLHVPATNYAMVGRWIGHFPRGQWAHAAIADARPVAGERAIGWIAHYCIGILYAGILVCLVGLEWLNAPTLPPALAFGVATVAAPFLIMQPAMGSGIASSKAARPNPARLRSLAAHTVFGVGLYLSATIAAIVPWLEWSLR